MCQANQRSKRQNIHPQPEVSQPTGFDMVCSLLDTLLGRARDDGFSIDSKRVTAGLPNPKTYTPKLCVQSAVDPACQMSNQRSQLHTHTKAEVSALLRSEQRASDGDGAMERASQQG